MSYHYETQPLPTPLAWYMHQLPLAAQKASTAFTFFAELLVPLLFFAPRPVRRIAAWITIALQVLILTTGNYTFFNWLTIVLCMWLFIEPAAHEIEPLRQRRPRGIHRDRQRTAVSGIYSASRCRPAAARSCTPSRRCAS